MEEALALLLFFLFVILPLYLSITNSSFSVFLPLDWYFSQKITLPLVILSLSLLSPSVLQPC